MAETSESVDLNFDKSRLVQILTWFLFVSAFVSVGARLGTKYAMTRSGLRRDDKIMLMSLATLLGQCLCVSMAASRGLGKHMNTLTPESVDNFLKAEYASAPLIVLTFALVKWSIAAFLNYITPDTLHQRITQGLRIAVGVWMVPTTFVSLFQCEMPAPWDYLNGSRCINRRALWICVGVLNIMTELCILALYVLIIGSLHISVFRRAVVLSIFFTRVLLIVAIVIQLAAFWDTYRSPDITYDLWSPAVLNQGVLCLSTVTACLPYLKPFMKSLESGVVRVGNMADSQEQFIESRAGSSGLHLNNLSNSTSRRGL